MNPGTGEAAESAIASKDIHPVPAVWSHLLDRLLAKEESGRAE